MKILTFDIEDWFHLLDYGNTKNPKDWDRFEPRIKENMERILIALDELGQKGTFFCLGWIAKKYPEIIREIHDLGHEIGTHGHFHQLVYEQDVKKFGEDLLLSIETLQNIIGEKVKSFRAPGFSITAKTLWAFEVLIENGIEIDCSVFPAPRAHGGFAKYVEAGPSIIQVNGGLIKEFPISLHSIINIPIIYSGGGYFRLLPYQLINRWCKEDSYVMTYFHPRDFDPGQPMIKGLSSLRKFRSYVGLNRSFPKFKKMLSNFDFIDLRTANTQVNWDTVQTISLN